jgi:hypothetical protein
VGAERRYPVIEDDFSLYRPGRAEDQQSRSAPSCRAAAHRRAGHGRADTEALEPLLGVTDSTFCRISARIRSAGRRRPGYDEEHSLVIC